VTPETTPPAVPTAQFRWVRKETWQQVSDFGFLGLFKHRKGSAVLAGNAVLQQFWEIPGTPSGGEWRDVPTAMED
jgi:hypothetical protein